MKFISSEYGARGHYTPGIISGNVLYISGQTSADPMTQKPAEGGVKAEMEMALKKLDKVLVSAGITRNEVIRCMIYVVDNKYWSEINEVYSLFFGNHKPARAVIPCGPLSGGCLIEITAEAEMPSVS